ncbi:MAG: ABC transporter permease [Planctomycetes bacterium]|nr:ABC transporter permease [Planctomycetota bacterium]MCC8116609.1 ABC transporter permease [Planctomycetota bacterium]
MSENNLLARLKNPTVVAFVVMVLAWVASAMLIRNFNTLRYNLSFIHNAAFLGIIVIGQAIVVISGGIDMSVSSVVTMSSVIASACIQAGMGTPAAIALALLASLAVGAFNATGIAWLRIPPIIMSIATISIIEGVLLIATNGTPPSGVTAFISGLSNGRMIWRLPNAVVVYAVLVSLAIWFMMFSRWGRAVYAIGTNERAAWLSGVGINSMKYLIYCLSSLAAGIAGILVLGYMGSTYLTIGTQYQLFSIAATVIGGISIIGGKGNFAGVIAGTFLIEIIRNALIVTKISPAGRELFQGLLILVVILAYGREKRQR